MSASLLRLSTRRLAHQTAPSVARRQASTAPHFPHAWSKPQYTLKERLSKFCPPEAYPLITIVLVMTSFGTTWGIKSFKNVPGELRLSPGEFKRREEERRPWEDERALQGRW